MLDQEEFKNFSPWLVSVLQTGSRVLPWIDNPHDHDYEFYVADTNDYKQLSELYKNKPWGECWFTKPIDENLPLRTSSYVQHFSKPIYGDYFFDQDIFNCKDEYKKVLIKTNENVKGGVKSIVWKGWYHILTGIYLLENGEYKLTEEQKANVNLCHDGNMTIELYNYIQEKLKAFKQELSY